MHRPFLRPISALAALSLLAGCGLPHQILGIGGASQNAALGQTAAAPSIFGYAVADEPQAALAARQILNQGGNAADAAAAAGFVLSVTLPSRAGLGGGGACIIKMPDAQGNTQPVELLFPPGTPASPGGSRPAATPTLARGLLALQARYGVLPAASVIVPAERLAGGVPISPALEADLQIVGNALLADPAAESVFGPTGTILPAGANLVQPDLAATLEALRVQGVQGVTSGSFATQFTTAANAAGASLTSADLAADTPAFTQPITSTIDGLTITSLRETTSDAAQPATAGFATLDKNGGAVTCDVTMNNLFGTGRIAAGTGILLAASPAITPPANLAASITTTPTLTFRAASTGTGQGAISYANAITCPAGVPGGETSCTATADPHGQGLAIGGR